MGHNAGYMSKIGVDVRGASVDVLLWGSRNPYSGRRLARSFLESRDWVGNVKQNASDS